MEAGELRPLEAGQDLLHLLPRVRPVQRQLAQHLRYREQGVKESALVRGSTRQRNDISTREEREELMRDLGDGGVNE